MARLLDDLLTESAKRYPMRTILMDSAGRSVSYSEFAGMTEIVADVLRKAGVQSGDRVGVWAPKSIRSLAAIFGILKVGGAYIPVDPTSPVSRAAYIFHDCEVTAIFCTPQLLDGLKSSGDVGDFGQLSTVELAHHDDDALRLAIVPERAGAVRSNPTGDLAYILYTSGSTGRPKGVMHQHASAFSFIDWCSDEIAPVPEDVFSSHAPFHFDLSIFDIYVPIKHGASIVLIDEPTGKQPAKLATLIAGTGMTVWYSTPSILRLLIEFGALDQHDCSHLRVVCFAGEVFPIKQFQSLARAWPRPRFLNLYGPTETNVCTFYEATAFDKAKRTTPLPIGSACSGDVARVVDPENCDVRPGTEGELLICGGSVMLGYWNLPERNDQSFVLDSDGQRWYHTGDIVIEETAGIFTFVGRVDRMVKRRSYRVELGEIEAGLYRHPSIREAAVVATLDESSGVLLTAYISCSSEPPPTIIDLKSFSAKQLPYYMVPDRFRILAELPKTSTDKIDYQRLKDT